MVSEADLKAYVSDPHMAEGLGHNVHVEDPAWVVSLVRALD
jgi:hypothetical protein